MTKEQMPSIKIKPETKQKLKELGKMGDSYTKIIEQLLEEHNQKKVKTKIYA